MKTIYIQVKHGGRLVDVPIHVAPEKKRAIDQAANRDDWKEIIRLEREILKGERF